MDDLFGQDPNSPSPLLVFEKPSGLAHVATAEGLPSTVHWLGDDGRNVFIEVQGQFAAIAVAKGPRKDQPKLRGKVNGFSAASRLRLFKTVNRLDFGAAGRCTFATQTWRDDLGRPTPKRITQARSWCQRSLEKLAGKKLPALWRIEWQLRKSGRYIDEYMPHLHCIYFAVPWIDRKDWTRAWGQAIGTTKGVSVKLKEIQNSRQCLYYVSKYVAKQDFDCNLDIPSNLNSHLMGRKWGTYRKDLMPFAPKFEMRSLPGELVEGIREIATRHWKGTPQVADMGFTVFGPAAKEIQDFIQDYTGHRPDGEIG